MFDRDTKVAKDIFGRKRKVTGCIYLPGSGFCEAEGRLSMRSCLQDAVINNALRIGNLLTNRNYKDSALLEEQRIHIYLR